MIPEPILQGIAARIQAIPELAGVEIEFQGNSSSRVLRHGFSATAESAHIIVIIEEASCSSKAEVDELERYAQIPGGVPAGAPLPQSLNRTKVTRELIGAGASCGFAIISGIGLVAAGVFSGGVGFLAVGLWSAGAIQCVNGVIRAAETINNPDSDSLEQWDSVKTYKYGMLFVDAFGVVGGAFGVKASVKSLLALMARNSALRAQLTSEALAAMNRAERLKVISEAFQQTATTEEGRRAIITAARAEGLGVAALQAPVGMSANHANKLVRIVSNETIKQIKTTTRETLLGAAGIAVSGTPDTLTGSASGAVYWIIHLIATGKT